MTTATVNIGALNRRIARVVQAELAESWRGSKHPDDWDDIELELKRAHKSLGDYLLEKRIT